MIGVNYKTKKDLKAAVGQPLRYEETSAFGPEYRENGKFCVVGPSPYDRKWFAEVTMENGVIKKVGYIDAGELTVEECRDILEKFNGAYPHFTEIFPESHTIDEINSQHWREHNAELDAFCAWQQSPDEDDTFPTIHVALLLSKERH